MRNILVSVITFIRDPFNAKANRALSAEVVRLRTRLRRVHAEISDAGYDFASIVAQAEAARRESSELAWAEWGQQPEAATDNDWRFDHLGDEPL